MSANIGKTWCLVLYAFLLSGHISCDDSDNDWMLGLLDSEEETSENAIITESDNDVKETSTNHFVTESDIDVKETSTKAFVTESDNDVKETSTKAFVTEYDNDVKETSTNDFVTESDNDVKETSTKAFVTESDNDVKETTIGSFSDVPDISLENVCDDPFRDMFDDGDKKCNTVTEEPPEDKNKCNLELIREVEKILTETYLDARSREPMDLDSDLQITFFMKIHDGKLTGLSALTNTTETKTYCNENSNIVIFNTTLRMRNAKIHYNWTRRGPFGFTQRGTFWMKADVLDFYLEVLLDMTDENKVTYNVTYTLFANPDDVTMEFKGLGLLDYGVNLGLRSMYKIFKGKLDKAIETAVKFVLEQKVGIVVQIHNLGIFQ